MGNSACSRAPKKAHEPIDVANKAFDQMESASRAGEVKEKDSLDLWAVLGVLRPFFWPSAGSDGVILNRLRAVTTWIMVGISKACSLYSPFFISSATNQLVVRDFANASKSIIAFCLLRFAAQFFKEVQSILYIKVKQQASIELQELTFSHLHKLSLNWHLTKKTGSVMKSMDRGTEAANTLVTYLFLFLMPALAECFIVGVLFFAQFQQWGLGVLVFAGVIMYSAATIIITQWRKKFREATNKHDNDFHDKANDSIVNYETVKYFCAEEFEVARFKSSVVKYQQYNSSTSLSLSLLNISQQFILIGTLLGAMLISGQAVSQGELTLGGWVAVQSWVAQIFVPLNFLGTVYAMIVQGLVDIKNLSELLYEQPDIVDEPSAVPFPPPVGGKGDKAGLSIEFKNVQFNYPEQPVEKGIKNLSFSIPPGSITAIVGSTGAGKTTISRLLFRFYDPHSGQVLIGGHDIRHKTQKSVRAMIGCVPQDCVLFNDTIGYNIKYGKMDATQEEIEAAAEAAQIKTFIESLPEGWNTVVGERGMKLR